MIWVALAVQLSAPVLADERIAGLPGIFSHNDFPAYLQRAGISRTVYTRTTVRPDGSVQSCTSEISSGDPKLDAFTCAIIMKRARFRPAKWSDGTAAFGVLRVPVSWTIADAPPSHEDVLRATFPDVEVSVNRLPQGARSIATVSLQVATDERGHPVSCIDNPPKDKIAAKRHFPELVPVARQQVMADWSTAPAVDDTGSPVRSIQTVSAHFKVDR